MVSNTFTAVAEGAGITGIETHRHLGEKRYEIKDHLGNVRAVVSDIKNAENYSLSASSWKFLADVRSLSNYYPYGMQIEAGSWSGGDYNYGYNGMLKEGIGKDVYNTHFRNLSVGDFVGWWSPDPLEFKFPNVSPYLSMGANPIKFTDINGDIIKIEGENETQKDNNDDKNDFPSNMRAHLNKLQETDKGKLVYEKLQSSLEVYTIENKLPSKGNVQYKDNKIKAGNINNLEDESYVQLGHDLYHAYQDEMGIKKESVETELEAYLFTAFLAKQTDHDLFSSSEEIINGETEIQYSFRQAFIDLQYSEKFSPELFNNASNLFKTGSPWKDTYSNFDILGNKFKPTINTFYPLMKTK